MIFNFEAKKNLAGLNFNINLDKNRNLYCFIGENGVGKTQLLETMAKSFLHFHLFLDTNSKIYKELYTKSMDNYQLILPLEFKINNKNVKTGKYQVSTFYSETHHIYGMINKIELFDNPIVFIGAKNRGYAKNIDINNIKIIGSKKDRFYNSFTKSFKQMNGEDIDQISVADWFVSRLIVNPAFVIEQTDPIDEVITVCNLIKELEPEKLSNLIKVGKDGKVLVDIVFHKGKLYFSGVPFEKLSTGYIAIIKIFQEIVDSYGSWRLDKNVNINEMEGVVFIDEVEAHLHPKWEFKIVPFLKKHFPNTKFYIATHSPLVISSTKNGESYELLKIDKTIESKKLGNPQNWYLADIYSQAFHINYDENKKDDENHIIELIFKFSELVKESIKSDNNSEKDKIDKIYKKLNSLLSKNDPRRDGIENLKMLMN